MLPNISDILEKIYFSGTNWACLSLGAGGTAVVNEPGHAMVYIVAEESVFVRRVHEEGERLFPGEAAIFLAGSTHHLCDRAGSLPIPISYFRQDQRPDSLPRIEIGGGGGSASVLAARLDLSVSSNSPLLALAPSTMLLRRYLGAGQTQINMQHIKEIFSRAKEPGGAAFLTRIANLLLLRGLQEHVTRSRNIELLPNCSGIARALQLITSELSTTWTVEGLAHAIGMSRSAFAAQFQTSTNQAPMEFVRDRRLERGAALLLEHGARIGDIAAAVGYRSEAAFARAFSRKYGSSPSDYRSGAKQKQKHAVADVGSPTADAPTVSL